MRLVSVVIITRNEEDILPKTLESLRGLTDDIIVVDSGSTDNTISIAKDHGATVLETSWDGFGANKNKGNKLAKHDWILSIDADELVDNTLRTTLINLDLSDPAKLYILKFKTFIAGQPLHHGQTAGETHPRLFNRQCLSWNLSEVHEELTGAGNIKSEVLKGNILHYSYTDLQDYIQKSNSYTTLRAMQMFQAGKKVTFFKLYLNPLYTFLLNYILKSGFLDGFWGYTYARLSSTYTYLKYAKLKELYAIHKVEEKPGT